MTVSNNVHYDYKLNQLVQKTYSSNDKEGTLYTYDGRGNLVSNDKYTRTTSGMAWQNEETYVYDETNHMVDGKNEKGERSLYTYNGLGLRVGRELIMQDNTHGYTDFHDETPSVETGLNKPEVAVESYVIDYTSPTFRTLVMEEEGGFDYRWVYGLDKLSVKITSEGTNWWGQNVKQDILKDYLHQDRLGSTTNLTDKFGRVVGRADYNEWGEITYKDALDITSAYRRIYPQLNYTGHDWDDVLEMYYAKARFYDPDAKRFVAIDPVKGQITDPLSLVSYLYCVDNPLRWVDPLGMATARPDSVVRMKGEIEYVVTTKGSPLNVRQDRSTTSQVLGQLANGTLVKSAGQKTVDGAWTWIEYENKDHSTGYGWVATNFLSTKSSASSVTPNTTPPSSYNPSSTYTTGPNGIAPPSVSVVANPNAPYLNPAQPEPIAATPEQIAAINAEVSATLSKATIALLNLAFGTHGRNSAFQVGFVSGVVRAVEDLTVGNLAKQADHIGNVITSLIYNEIHVGSAIYDAYVDGTNSAEEVLANATGSPEAFYAGRIVADALMRAFGIAAKWIGTAGTGAGTGLAMGAASQALVFAGIGGPAGLAIDTTAVATGAVVAIGGVAIAAAGASIEASASERLDHDSDKYREYQEKIGCKDFKEKASKLLEKCKKRNTTKGNTHMYTREGLLEGTEFDTAKTDFDSLNLNDIQTRSSSNGHTTYIGLAEDGTRVNLHFSTSEEVWTLEIGNIKIRYGK